MLSEAGIMEYSKRLTNELGRGYTISNLKRFRQFYNIIEKRCDIVAPIELESLLRINTIS